ncbi:MAG: DUF1800 domain-containing protein, partial [Bacteroidia bacterium]
TGSWTQTEAAHLLRRTMFGATYQQIQDAVSNGLAATVNSLLTIPVIDPPVAYDPGELVVPVASSWASAQTWVNAAYPSNDATTRSARQKSTKAWLMRRISLEQVSIAEKICWFWHNHFAVRGHNDAIANFKYFDLIRTHALGDFKQLVKDMTITPSMLSYLNNNTNQVNNPNENYARELLELYTIGKGPQVGPGDYTTYTETDVAEAAKALTGWVINNYMSQTSATITGSFVPGRHDTTTKTFSPRLGNATISNGNATEYETLIDLIFQQPNFAEFICIKLYRYFVNYDITPTVLSTIIPGMMQTLTTNNFSIYPVMQDLLLSQHFFDNALRGTIIKSPAELLFSMVNPTSSTPAFAFYDDNRLFLRADDKLDVLGQDPVYPPNVGGWIAYYHAPGFSRNWVSPTQIVERFNLATQMSQGNGLTYNGNKYKTDALAFLAGLSIPSDPVAVIDDICLVFLPKPISAADKLTLKNILCNGLPDFEWTQQYTDYLSNPTNPTFVNPVVNQLNLTLSYLFKMPQFQTI